jgi:hypothetical protein
MLTNFRKLNTCQATDTTTAMVDDDGVESYVCKTNEGWKMLSGERKLTRFEKAFCEQERLKLLNMRATFDQIPVELEPENETA